MSPGQLRGEKKTEMFQKWKERRLDADSSYSLEIQGICRYQQITSHLTKPNLYTRIFCKQYNIFSYLVKMFISLLIKWEYEVTGEKYLTRELCYYD